MKNPTQIRDMIANIDYDLRAYNNIFKLGYKVALEDVLEIKRPKVKPSKGKGGVWMKDNVILLSTILVYLISDIIWSIRTEVRIRRLQKLLKNH